MAHYDCSCCGESMGVSHSHCDGPCKEGTCPLALKQQRERRRVEQFPPPPNRTHLERFRELAARCAHPTLSFQVGVESPDSRIYWLRVQDPKGLCNVTGESLPWSGRKWRLSPHMTDGEVVFTALKALLTALEHEAREQFTFDGVAVGNSHVDIHALVRLLRGDGGIKERAHVAPPVAPSCDHQWRPIHRYRSYAKDARQCNLCGVVEQVVTPPTWLDAEPPPPCPHKWEDVYRHEGHYPDGRECSICGAWE